MVVPAAPGPRTVDQRWNAVIAGLKGIGKDSRNKEQGFMYRSIDAVLKHAHGLFADHGVHVIPVEQHATYGTRTTAKGSVWTVCHVEVIWQVRGVEGDSFTAMTVGEGTDSGDKATSKAQTMAFKYLLWPALMVADHEDPDGETPDDAVDTYAPVADAPPARSRTSRPPPGGGAPPPPSANGDGELLAETRQLNEIRRILAPQGKTSDRDVLTSVKSTLAADRQDVAVLAQLTQAEAAAAIHVFSGGTAAQ